jgi:hypothetical protein
MRRILSTMVLVVAAAMVAAPAGVPAAAAAAAAGEAAPGGEVARADFDDDGFVDLAVGVPGEDVEALADAGSVVVLYGSAAGLTGARAQQFHQNLPQLVDRAESGDRFGAALATGDLNGDGFADLAVGVPGEDFGDAQSTRDSGAAVVLFGTSGGLTTAGDWIVSPRTERGDQFGSAVAVGPFDGVAGDDLAVGAPGADVGAAADAGAVVVVGGTTADFAARHVQGAGGVGGAAEPGDRFGASLASADLSGDGRPDLVAGAPREAVGTAAGAGAVVYLPGSAGGLTASGSRVYVQGSGGLGGRAEAGDRFGEVLATGQANAGGPADLVVGAPGENLAAGAGAGAVSVLYGAPGGPSTAGDQLFSQGAGGIPDAPETNDGFGSALAVGDLDGDSFADLAVGVPGEEYFAATDVGDVILLHGTAGGLSGAGAQSMQQEISNIGSNEAGDHIGSALAARDFDADGAGDLVVGMPGEDIDKTRDAGAIAYHQGPLGPERPESRPLHADSAGVPGAAEPGDRFGAVLGPGPLGG